MGKRHRGSGSALHENPEEAEKALQKERLCWCEYCGYMLTYEKDGSNMKEVHDKMVF